MKTIIGLNDLDLKPISHLPHSHEVVLPERPNHLFNKKIRKLPQDIPYLV